MDIIFAFLTSFFIFFTFKVLEVRLVKFNFTFHELVLGKFDPKYMVTTIIIPFTITLIFGLIHKTQIPAVYSIPGFLAALLLVWPYYRNIENVPSNMRYEKGKMYVAYIFFIASFTLFSYLGGYIGNRGLPSFLPSAQGIIDGFWIIVLGAFFTYFVHRYLNRKFPQMYQDRTQNQEQSKQSPQQPPQTSPPQV